MMANNIIEYRAITPTTIVPTISEVQYLTVTYLVSEDNLTIPITNNPSGIKSIIIDGVKNRFGNFQKVQLRHLLLLENILYSLYQKMIQH